MSNYPNSLDNFSNPSSSDLTNSGVVPHAQQHANVNDAIEAIQAVLGILPQGGFETVKARLQDIENDLASIGSSMVSTMLDNSISTAKIQNLAVNEFKLGNNSVSSDKLKSAAVTSDKILDGAVSANKIAADAITYQKVAASSKLIMTRTAVQALGGTSGAYISWDTKPTDTDGFVVSVPNTTVTIPVAKDGLYIIATSVYGFANTSTDYIQIDTGTPAATPGWRAGSGGAGSSTFALCDLAAGDPVKVWAFNGSASSINLKGRFIMVKLFDA